MTYTTHTSIPSEDDVSMVLLRSKTHTVTKLKVLLRSLGTRPSLAEEEEGPVNLHTYKFEVRGISAE